jgi:hypothetical protein
MTAGFAARTASTLAVQSAWSTLNADEDDLLV